MIERDNRGEFNFASVLDFLLRHKWSILVTALVAGLAGYIFSAPIFIHPKFKSTAVLFPTTTSSISKVTTSTNPSDKGDLMELGKEEEAEQLLQFLKSDEIANKIISKYHLMKHYRIDTQADYPYTRLMDEFNDNVKFRRTELLSVEVTVWDENPDTAAMIANDITKYLDTVKTAILRQRAQEALNIVQQKYNDKIHFINQITDSLQKIGEMGVYNYVEQSSVVSDEYARALASHDPKLIAEIGKQRELLGKYGPIQKSLFDRAEFENEELTLLKAKLEQAQVDATQMLQAAFIVNKAAAPEKKSYPVRPLIVFISMLSAAGMSILFFAVVENYRNYRRERALEKAVSNGRELVEV